MNYFYCDNLYPTYNLFPIRIYAYCQDSYRYLYLAPNQVGINRLFQLFLCCHSHKLVVVTAKCQNLSPSYREIILREHKC